jgi:hypothetical protein
MARRQSFNFAGDAISFPIALGQQRIGFPIGSLVVTNNTPRRLFLARNTPNPDASSCDAVCPPYFALPFYGWDRDTLYIGSDQATLSSFSSVVVQLSDTSDVLPTTNVNPAQWYDRNPTVSLKGGNTNGLPNNVTLFTYTVPSNKRAYLDACFLELRNRAALSGGVASYSYCAIFLDGTTMLDVSDTGGTVGATGIQRAQIAQGGILTAGQVLTSIAHTFFTAGNADFLSSAKITEFDA